METHVDAGNGESISPKYVDDDVVLDLKQPRKRPGIYIEIPNGR